MNKHASGAVRQQPSRNRSLTEAIIPGTLHYGRKGKALYRDSVIPGVRLLSRPLKKELLKIHRKQNLLEKFRLTLLHKGLGLYLAILSAKMVGNFFEVRSANNLWGIFPQEQLVSHTTFAAISFSVEFIVALTVFTLSDHYLEEFRQWRKQRKSSH